MLVTVLRDCLSLLLFDCDSLDMSYNMTLLCYIQVRSLQIVLSFFPISSIFFGAVIDEWLRAAGGSEDAEHVGVARSKVAGPTVPHVPTVPK